MEISVSYLVSRLEKKRTIEKLQKSKADYIHVDLMDGGFVPTKNFTMEEIEELFLESEKPLDVHLMVFDPIIYVERLAKLQPVYITFQVEATKDVVKTLEQIKKHGIKVGLAIKPGTDILELMPYFSMIDLVLIMSVEPGMGGQSFIETSRERLKQVREIREKDKLNFKIEMDGGINEETIKLVPELDIAVSGSFVCRSDDFDERIERLKLK